MLPPQASNFQASQCLAQSMAPNIYLKNVSSFFKKNKIDLIFCPKNMLRNRLANHLADLAKPLNPIAKHLSISG